MPNQKDAAAELAIPAGQREPTAHPEFKAEKQVVMTSRMVSAVPMIQVPVKVDSPSTKAEKEGGEDDDDDDDATPRADMQINFSNNNSNNNDDDDDEDVTPRADASDFKNSSADTGAKTSVMDGFDLLGVLGVGAFAECHLAQRKDDSKLFALKKFKKVMDVLTPQERQEAIGEVRLLANLVQPNILRYEDSFLEGGTMHILMEYASGGTLDRLIDSYKAKGVLLGEELVWNCMVQLLGALRYCHSRNIMHRDIKPQNVMLSTADERTCRLLLGDFGIAKIMANQGAQTHELAGTPYYYSPELCKNQAYDNKSDMWAIGVVLFELMAQKRPFESNNTFRVLYLISKNERDPTPTTFCQDLQDMCNDLLEVDPADRPSAADLMSRDVMVRHAERWQKHVDMLDDEEASADARGNNAQATATTYHKVMERLKYLCRWASNLGAEDANDWYDAMERISLRIHKNPELHHVDIYNQLGMVNAEAGNFDEAIATFRQTLLIDKDDHLAMEQLGNLLVRSAFQMFKDREEHERARKIMSQEGKVPEGPQRNTSKAKMRPAPVRHGSNTDAIQQRLDEGISFLEKVVEMEVSDERLALLGSAYKRLFMLQNGFFPKARGYLKKASEYYHKADVEQKRRNGDGCYAILNALWLDMLLGESQNAYLLAEAVPLSSAALEQQAHAPADVWLWVQVADILCIRYTLSDPEIVLEGVTLQYRKALELGSSDRVKRSIEDQLHFMQRTLQMRRQQMALDGMEKSNEYLTLAIQLKRLTNVLKFVTEQSLMSRSITKSITQRRVDTHNNPSRAPPPGGSKGDGGRRQSSKAGGHSHAHSHSQSRTQAAQSDRKERENSKAPDGNSPRHNGGDPKPKPKSDVCVVM